MTKLKDLSKSPKVGMVSLGCPKALVDSERILTQLRADGYTLGADYAGADVVLVNTCGFLDSARAESLDAIGEAMAENGRVIVTGCLGKEAEMIREKFPHLIAITGPQQYEQVVSAVRTAAPPPDHPFVSLKPEGVKLTPRHYSYLKISEGCNHRCSFCIIPALRGDLVSRPAHAVLREAEKLAESGCKELLIVSQDTSAYGLDLRHADYNWKRSDGTMRPVRAHLTQLAEALGDLGVWVRLHYVYPYPHVDDVIPLMAQGKILPYLDMPLQHSAPGLLKSMRRPANQVKTLERLQKWREICPDITVRSTFIVGFPGETEADFNHLLQWLEQAQLDRVGCFKFEPVKGAAANDLPDAVPEEVKQDRWDRFMATQQAISARKLAAKIGTQQAVILDEVDGEGGATGRSRADAPEIDGVVHLREVHNANIGDIILVDVEDADDYDLFAAPVGAPPLEEGN